MELELTEEAIFDIKEVKEYYKNKIPKDILFRIISEIEVTIETINSFPEVGRVIDVEGLRKFGLVDYNYAVLYIIVKNKIYILRILDTRRKI